MQRRVGINNVSPIFSLVQDNKKHVNASVNKDDHYSEFLPERSGESSFSASTSLRVPFIQKPHTSQIVANTSALSPCDLPPPSVISVRHTDQIVVNQPDVLQKLSIFNWHSQSSYTQVNGHVEDFASTTTFTSQNHIESPLQSSYSGLMVEPSTFPVRYSGKSAHDSPFLSCKREATHGSQCQQSVIHLPPLFQVNSSIIIIILKQCSLKLTYQICVRLWSLEKIKIYFRSCQQIPTILVFEQ